MHSLYGQQIQSHFKRAGKHVNCEVSRLSHTVKFACGAAAGYNIFAQIGTETGQS